MTEISHNVRLTSAEIANLWSQYINDSMSMWIIRYYIKNVQDPDIRSILEFALKLSQTHQEKVTGFLNDENYPIPQGFTSDDVNLDAPPLFSDVFIISYMHIMTIHGLTGYAGAVSTSIRHDQVNYFIQCNTETLELYKRTVDVLLKKGIVSRPPSINAPEKVDFVKKQSFLTGWFGERRPLNAVEVSGIFFNMQKNIVKIVLEIGFSQVARSKEIREYIKRGEKICDKHFDTFSALLSESNLPSPKKLDSEVTSSTVAPFSDKLMLFQIVSLISTASGYYGAAFSLSQRRDLATKYITLIADVTKYAEDGVNILINNGWMEQPPTFDDRNKLANHNHE
ncbi:DUF3231 family protein [Bacillus sp. Marseille-P3661]|uniref:DUF3231 family protein n=1 Tax=Bacillus sp. Marseille-P3661 TaxID=1936234 RepID=UPI000C82414B|nr:DUF3231 family protein [Bacillus sp. Marseille-P3661]